MTAVMATLESNLLYAPSHKQDITYHSLCYTSRRALVGLRNSSTDREGCATKIMGILRCAAVTSRNSGPPVEKRELLLKETKLNVLFNDALNTFYLRLYGVRHMVNDHSDSERGIPRPPYGLLFSISSKRSFICIIPLTHITAFVTPVVDHWLERKIAQWVPTTHLPRANALTAELHLGASCSGIQSGNSL